MVREGAGMAARKRTRTWERCIAALLETPTIEAASVRAGVGLRTLKDYLADPAFLQLYRDARRGIVEAAVTRLQQLSTRAVLALHRSLDCGVPAVESRTALGVWTQVLKSVEVFDLVSQVEELRQQLAEVVARHGNGRTPKAGGEANGRATAAGPRPAP
jgi:hypothetical protein